MAAYRRVDDLQSPAIWLPVHRDQLRAQRSVSSMGSLYLFNNKVTSQSQIFPRACPASWLVWRRYVIVNLCINNDKSNAYWKRTENCQTRIKIKICMGTRPKIYILRWFQVVRGKWGWVTENDTVRWIAHELLLAFRCNYAFLMCTVSDGETFVKKCRFYLPNRFQARSSSSCQCVAPTTKRLEETSRAPAYHLAEGDWCRCTVGWHRYPLSLEEGQRSCSLAMSHRHGNTPLGAPHWRRLLILMPEHVVNIVMPLSSEVWCCCRKDEARPLAGFNALHFLGTISRVTEKTPGP